MWHLKLTELTSTVHRHRWRTAAALISLVLPSAIHGQTRVSPVAAADTLHGVTILDPFRHMEQQSSDETMRWVRAQDEIARRFASGAQNATSIRRAVGTLARSRVSGPPVRRGAREFYTVRTGTGPGAALEFYVRAVGDTSAGVRLIDGAPGTGAATAIPSPDGLLVAVAVPRAGSNWSTIRVMRSTDGTLLPDSVPGLYRTMGGIRWSADGRGFFYQRSEGASAIVNSPVGRSRIMYHRVGTGSDVEVFKLPAADSNSTIALGLAPTGGTTLVVIVTDNSSGATRLFVTDAMTPGSPVRAVSAPSGSYSFAGEARGTLYFASWAGASRGRVIALQNPLIAPAWREVVKEGAESIDTWPGVGVNVLGGGLLVAYAATDGGLRTVFFDLDGKQQREIRLPARGSVWSGFVGHAQSDTAFYQLTGLADPGTVYQLVLSTGVSTPYARRELGYDPGDIITERIEVPTSDGERVPVDVVRRRSTPLDGSAPLILYGYGFGGWIAAPWFQPAMAHWVDRGGIWAVASVRGDGARGERWRAAGARRNKPVGIRDYLEVTTWLSANGYTRPDRMVANASSAGGPLVAAAVLQRPEAFRAAIFDYSIFDMLRYDRFSHGRQWVTEYGTATDRDDFAVLRSYSPYHNVVPGRCYPAMLVTPGELDQTAPPFHSYKFIAALQASAPDRCADRPALLRVSWGAGHQAGATPEDAAETWADELSFLERVLPTGVWPSPPNQ